MAFKLVHAKYDRESERAYVELRDEDDDGGEIEILAVSFRTTARLSKQQIEQDIVRKARHILKRAAASTSASPAPRSAPHQPGHGASAAAGRNVRHVSRSSNSPPPASVQNTGASRCCGNKVKPSPRFLGEVAGESEVGTLNLAPPSLGPVEQGMARIGRR